MTEPAAVVERRQLAEWIQEAKRDTRFLHELVCEAVHHPATAADRQSQVRSALEATRSGSSAAATAAIMNVAVRPTDAATLASRDLEKKLRSLVFEDEDELLAVVKEGAGTSAGAAASMGGVARRARAGRGNGLTSAKPTAVISDSSAKRVMGAAADLRQRAHGRFRKGYLVPDSGGPGAASAAGAGGESSVGGPGGSGARGGGDRPDGSSRPQVAFGSIRELLRLRDGAVTALVSNLLERHDALQASLGLSGWETGPAGTSGGSGKSEPEGSGRTARVRRLRDGASVFAAKVADIAGVFDSLDSILRRVRLAEEGRATSATIMRLQHELDEAKAQLEEKDVTQLQLQERLNALKQSTSGGPTTQALEIDAQLLRAQQTRAVLRTRDQEVEQLLRECNEQREHNEALQREMATLKARLGSTREALRPRVAEVEARTREGLTAVQDLRQSLDLLAGMYQRVCDQLASGKRNIDELTGERDRLARALHTEVKSVGLLTGEVARMDAVNVRLMAAHDSLRAAYRRAAREQGAGGGRAWEEAVREEEESAMARLAAGVSSVAREALDRLRMVRDAGGDGLLVALEGLKRVVEVCSTARGAGGGPRAEGRASPSRPQRPRPPARE